MIKTIREYFQARINEIDPDIMPQEQDVFGNNDVDAVEAEKTYNLIIGETTTTRQDLSILDETTVDLDIWSSRGIQVFCNYEDLYCLALRVRNNLIKFSNVESEPCLSQVIANNITPLEEETNDNVFKMRLNFTVRVYYQL